MTLREHTTTAAGTEAHEPIVSAGGVAKTYRTGKQEVRAGELVTGMTPRRETP